MVLAFASSARPAATSAGPMDVLALECRFGSAASIGKLGKEDPVTKAGPTTSFMQEENVDP